MESSPTSYDYEFCAAYPDGDGIPAKLYFGGHFEPEEGDHGIQFTHRPDATYREKKSIASAKERYFKKKMKK